MGFASWEEAQPVGSKVRKMNQIEVRRRHATSGLTIRGAKLFFKKVHTLRGWDRREARLRLFGNPKHITPKFASCATSITWRATRPWARQSGARSYAIVDVCICRETGERGANPILSKRGNLRTPSARSVPGQETRHLTHRNPVSSRSPRRDLGRTQELVLRNKRAHISQKARLRHSF